MGDGRRGGPGAAAVIGIGVLSTLTSRLAATVVFACTVAALSVPALVMKRLEPAASGSAAA